MVNYITKHNGKILKYNSDNYIVGYNNDVIVDFVVEGYGTGISQVNVVDGTSVNFTNLSTNSTSWLWNFGDNSSPSTSTLQNPTGITYTVSGTTSTVSLTSYNDISYNTKIRTNYINITELQGKKLLVNINASLLDSQPQSYTWNPLGGTEVTRYFNSYYSTYNVQNTGITLYYDDNILSDYELTTLLVFTAEYTNGVSLTGGTYPVDVQYRNFASWFGTTPKMRLSGLNNGISYKLTFFGSRGDWTATTRYTITGGTSSDGSYVDLDTNNNYLNTVSISGIYPSLSGTIDFTVYWQNSQAYLGAIEIEEGG